MSFPVAFGEGADVMAAVWGAVARVRELVTLRSQGAVRFQPTGPEGAVPLTPWSGEERRAGERLPKASRGSDGVSIHGRRIVVADDDPAVVWFMSSLLRAVGAEVIEAHDGRRALEIARDIWPDAVISDVLMPELDGFSLCHEIKRDIAVRDTPVILLSWKEDLLQRLRELGADADGYLRKEAAASAVVERVREVLRPRARVEQRIEAGGEVRGRLDGLTPRLLLELVCKHRRDARISVRDAVYLWELSLREGRLLSITRSSAQGDFARGPRVLPGLLGVTAGRFVIEPDSTPTRGEFEGDLRSIVQEPIERARAALKAVAADALVRIKGLTFDREGFDPYLGCTPEPALGLLRRLFAAAGPRDLVLTGQADPRLLENVLSDLARRGVIVGVEREPSASLLPPSPANVGAPVAAPAAVAPKVTAAPPADETELDWDDEGSEDDVPPVARARRSVAPAASAVSEPMPAVPQTLTVTGSSGLPLNAEPTPGADWTVGPLFAFGGDDRNTLQGVGSLPTVKQRPAPSPAPAPAAAPRPAPMPEPRPVASPTPSPVRAEGAEIANLMGLTETPAPAVAVPKPAPSPAPAPTAVAPSPVPAPVASPPSPAISEALAEPVPPSSQPLAQAVESRTHSPFSEPPPVPSAPLTTDALLAALSPAAPVAEPKPSEPPPSSSLTVGEGELIDSNNVQSVPPSEPPPEPEDEEEPESSPPPPPKKTAKKAEKADETKLEPKKSPSSEAPKKAESGGALRPLIIAALSFAAVYLVVKLFINPSAEVTPIPAASVARPAPPPKPTAEALRVETELPVPVELASETPPGAGWLQIEVPGADPLYVDGENVGRGPSRRMSLTPGKHQVEVGQAAEAKKTEVDIKAAMLTRVSLAAPAQPK